MSNTDKTFEEKLADLESIVSRLERGDVPLEKAISEFQEGMKLSKDLQATLAEAEKTLVETVKNDVQETDGETRGKDSTAR